MCWIAVAAVASVAAGAMSAYGQTQSAGAASAAGKFNASMMERDAQLADQQAQLRERQGVMDEAKVRRDTARTMGAQRSILAGSGVDVGSGSALDILTDTDRFGELDALETKYQSDLDAWSIRNQSQSMRAQAKMERQGARNAATAGMLGAGSTLLTTASSTAMKGYEMKTRKAGF